MIWKRKKASARSSEDYIYIKKQDKIIAIISKDNFACAFINDYNKRRKLKIRLVTHDFIDGVCPPLALESIVMTKR